MRVYNQKKKKVVMNGRDYLEHSDWSTMGRFFNVTAQTKSGSVRYVDLGTRAGLGSGSRSHHDHRRHPGRPLNRRRDVPQ
jgi:hypothetical protein